MLSQHWHKAVIAYRLEDKFGNAPPYYCNGHKALLPCGYDYAYLNPSIFREKEYKRYYNRYTLYEYLFFSFVLTYDSGEVLYKQDQIISKAKVGR